MKHKKLLDTSANKALEALRKYYSDTSSIELFLDARVAMDGFRDMLITVGQIEKKEKEEMMQNIAKHEPLKQAWDHFITMYWLIYGENPFE